MKHILKLGEIFNTNLINMTKKIDITSTAIEKGIDIAKNFLDKLILPPIEETGLLIKDQVTMWRFKNQIKMINKAKSYCEKYNVNPKTISLKLLCPILEYSSLEEEEKLQDKWAILLTNMVDSEQNIENHVFPYILSQISSTEFGFLENVYDDKILRQNTLKKELNIFKLEMPTLIQEIKTQIKIIDDEIELLNIKNDIIKSGWNREKWVLQRDKEKLDQEIKSLERKEISYSIKIHESQVVPEDLEEFEMSNLSRLGLIRYVQKFYANSQTLEIPYEFDEEHRGRTTYSNIDLDVDIESDEKYILTELGELFIGACKIKTK